LKFGIVCDRVDDVALVTEAEAMGYDFCWAFDSPMLRSNPFVLLGLAARETRRIRLGVGVAVCGLRQAPEAANAIATVNRLAPGRTFLGLGTGNTAMRTLGRRPMRLKPFRRYVEVVRGLLAGDSVSYAGEDGEHPVVFQNQELGFVDVTHAVPVHVGGFGPRAQALAGELGDALITGFPRGGSPAAALANAAQGARRAGRSLQDFEVTALVNVLMLQPGETLRSPRVVAECGPSIMANIHYLVDLVRETGAAPPDYVLPIWEEYLSFHRSRDAATAHQALHESHYSHLDPDEARFVTPEMIQAFCLAGHPEEIVEQVRGLQAQGVTGLTFVAPDGEGRRQYGAFARRVMAQL
jgi:alkanesulfonate monooxygenase SsuD/methylene tetrahydromethanopterin reductase-like flavin-dependent oxidoreductase (luciferase family)